MDEEREGTLLCFFRLGDDDTDESMATALLRCLFRNLMFYQAADGHRLSADERTSSRPQMPLSRVIELAQGEHARSHDQMQRALLLAVKWNQPDFCKQMLIELPDEKVRGLLTRTLTRTRTRREGERTPNPHPNSDPNPNPTRR